MQSKKSVEKRKMNRIYVLPILLRDKQIYHDN